MNNPSAKSKTCTRSLKLLADFWSLRIIESLKDDSQRYCGIQRALDNVNPATLTKKLSDLEEAGLIIRQEGNNGHLVEYALSDLGREALPIIKAIDSFSKVYEN